MSYLVTKELNNLKGTLNDTYSVTPATVKDSTEAESKEIVVDGANRREKTVFSNYNEWQIECVGSKLYVEGGHNYAVVEALKVLGELITEGSEIRDGMKLIGRKLSGDTTGGYRLTEKDEFDERKLSDLWVPSFEVSTGYNGKTLNRTSSPDNLYLADGYLHEKGTQDANNYYSSRVESRETMWFQYGYTEVSAKLAAGPGFWCAFYVYGLDAANKDTGFPEYDIVECYGDSAQYGSNSNYYRFTPHAWTADNPNLPYMYYGDSERDQNVNPFVTLPEDESFGDNFHTFGLEWDENWYRFTCDGEIVGEYRYSDFKDKEGTLVEKAIGFYRQPAHIMLGLSVGQQTDLTVAPPEDFSAVRHDEFVVDYFHLYQQDGQIKGTSYQDCLTQIQKNSR